MKKKMFLVPIFLLLLILSACGSTTWEYSEISMDTGDGFRECYDYQEGAFYFVCNGPTSGSWNCYQADSAGTIQKSCSCSVLAQIKDTGGAEIFAAGFSSDSIWISATVYDGLGITNNYITQYDWNGNSLWTSELAVTQYAFDNIKVLSDSVAIISSREDCYYIDTSTGAMEAISHEGQIYNLVSDSNGDLYAVIDNVDHYSICELDVEQRAISTEAKYTVENSAKISSGSAGAEFMLVYANEIRQITAKTHEADTLISDFQPEESIDFMDSWKIDDSNILTVNVDWDTGVFKLGLFTAK